MLINILCFIFPSYHFPPPKSRKIKKEDKDKAFFGKKPSLLIHDHLCLFPKNVSFLDLGCGQGNDLLFMNKLGYKCLGVDNSSIAIEQLRKKIKQKILKDIKLEHVDISEFNFLEKRYAIINLRNVLQYLEKDNSQKMIKKVQKYVKKNGFIVISALTMEDPSYSAKTKGFKSYFDKNELLRYFATKFNINYYFEGPIQEKGHGDYPPHEHGMVMLIAQKK